MHYADSSFVILHHADSDFSRDITMNAYENLLKEAFLNTLGFEVDIKILVKDKEEVNETEEKDIEVKVADFSDEENNNLTFDNFIKGKSNDLAYAFSTAVAHKYDEDQKTPSNSTLSSYTVILDLEKLTL